jgi:hypothetical protein
MKHLKHNQYLIDFYTSGVSHDATPIGQTASYSDLDSENGCKCGPTNPERSTDPQKRKWHFEWIDDQWKPVEDL